MRVASLPKAAQNWLSLWRTRLLSNKRRELSLAVRPEDGCGVRAGLPAVAVPGGADKDGLPIGIQVVGRAFGEETVLAMARALEREFVRIWFAVFIA
jgi:hypothetical protein